jgi:GntR family transcriptional regulator
VIDPDLPVARWVQLADILRARIHSGELTGRLPSELTLQQEYGVARNTVRHAMRQLQDEGLVEIVPAVGAFVRKNK